MKVETTARADSDARQINVCGRKHCGIDKLSGKDGEVREEIKTELKTNGSRERKSMSGEQKK